MGEDLDSTVSKRERPAVPPRAGRLGTFLPRLLFALAVFAVTAEVGSRLYWASRGLSFVRCQNQIHHTFYPPMKEMESMSIGRDDGYYDVLLLGASVLQAHYTTIERTLAARLAAPERRVRVHNLAFEGHSTLDSYYKYRHLRDKRFDLVIVYHGINETRANNCPPEMFRDDYSHYSWYQVINDVERHAGTRWLALPLTLELTRTLAMERLGWREFVPEHEPRSDWIEYASVVRTREPFRRNLARILELAEVKGETVVLMTFGYYLPPQYPNVAPWWFPVEGWGKPEHVANGIAVHNAAVKEVVADREGVVFVDQDRLIPKERVNYRDICHFTPAGSRRFVDNLLETLCREKIVCAGRP